MKLFRYVNLTMPEWLRLICQKQFDIIVFLFCVSNENNFFPKDLLSLLIRDLFLYLETGVAVWCKTNCFLDTI